MSSEGNDKIETNLDTTDNIHKITNENKEEEKELKHTKLKQDEKSNENITEKEESVHAGKNEFNINVSNVTKQLRTYGINLFSEGIEFTKQILQKQQKISYSKSEIDGNYEIIDESVKNIIITDERHVNGQIFLMKSDTRIQERIIGFLIAIGIELAISDWTWFDILITGILKCGTIKIINYIDKDLIGKILLGMCWIIPPFIKHFFDKNINIFISNIIIQIHSFICLLMIIYSIYDIIISANKYDWKKSILFSVILIIYSIFYYLLFYSKNIFNTLFAIILIPICWKFIKLKSGLKYYEINKYMLYKNKNKLKDIYNSLYAQELYINENEYVINKVCQITKDVVKKRKRRKYCAFCALLMLWICFVMKLFGHFNYFYNEYKIEKKYISLGDNIENDIGINNIENKGLCDNNDVLCDWIINEMKLSQYLNVFREHGFETIELICLINENNLKVMQIYKQAHINLFIKFTQSKQCEISCDNQQNEICQV